MEGDKNFGKYHIHLKHGKQIKEAGYSSIEEFVELVAKNYNQIRKGSRPDRDTYLLEVHEKHNNTLFVELSKDGSYWNVNSAGIFREAYSRNKEIIWSASEVQNQQPGTVDENLRSAQITGTSYTPPTGTSPETISLQGKDTKTEENKQALQQKKTEPTKGSQEAIDWDSPPAETDEKAKINKEFNEELQRQINGDLPSGHIYQLGNPSNILQAAGIPNLPIEMSSQRLLDKSKQKNHKFDLSKVKDLPKALQNPIAIFSYGDKSKAVNIIVEIEYKGKKFLVGLSLDPAIKGIKLGINSIRSVFPKDTHEWVNWIIQGKGLYFDKEKVLNILTNSRIPADVAFGLPGNQVQQDKAELSDVNITKKPENANKEKTPDWLGRQRSNYAEAAIPTKDIVKIINTFKNPTIYPENNNLYRVGDKENPLAINDKFNEDLSRMISGNLKIGHTFELGNPNPILRSAGLPDLPIQLNSSRLRAKSKQEEHPFDLSEIADLPLAVQNPLVVFRSATREGDFVILTDIQHKGEELCCGR